MRAMVLGKTQKTRFLYLNRLASFNFAQRMKAAKVKWAMELMNSAAS